jgi:hypothetical protein
MVRLKIGDTILVLCPREKLSKIRNSNEFIVIEDIHHSMIDTEKARMAAVLLLPIAVTTAASLGADPRPFIIGICFGASACFATPIGYQTNLLVYGPGRYRFSDYMKLGLPLNIMVIVLSTRLIPFFWPF